MRELLSGIGWTGLLLSATVHFLTFIDILIFEKYPNFWWLHIGAMILIIPTFFSMFLETGEFRRSRFWSEIFKVRPPWFKWTILGFFAYAMLSFLLGMFLLGGGSPQVHDSCYGLYSGGQLLRELSEPEYRHFKAIEVRFFSSFWMLFFSIPALYYGSNHTRRNKFGA